MATLNVFACSFLLLLCISACNSIGVEWCVVSQRATEDDARNYLSSTCKETDCSAVERGGDCFEPNDVISHASYVLNLKYRQFLTCPSYIGALTSVDPSSGKCKYP